MTRWSISEIIPAVLMLMTVYCMTLILLIREQPGFRMSQLKERAIQIAAQRALRRAEEEQVLYFSLTLSSGVKWGKYKALESILNAGNFGINLEGLNICGDKDEGLSSEGQKSVVDFDKPITAVEEHITRILLWKVPRIISSKNRWPLKQFAHLCLNPPSARLGDTVPRAQKRLAEKWGNDSAWVGGYCVGINIIYNYIDRTLALCLYCIVTM